MNLELALTSKGIVIAGAIVVAVIVAIILVGRYLITKRSEGGLSSKYEGKDFESPLVGRNKYPDVDVFAFSKQFFMAGLIFSLLMTVGIMGVTSYDQVVDIPDNALEMEEDIEIEPPRTEEPPPPPPPPPPPVITEVPDEEFLEEEEDLEFIDQSVSEETVVEAEAVVEKPIEEAPPPPPPPPPPEPDIAEIFQVVEEMPRFDGCEDIGEKKAKYECATKKMLEFIYGNIKYPTIARENNIEGTVVVRFVVNENGKVSDAHAIRDIGGGCGNEAVRIVNLMNENGGSWHPGRQRDRPVKVQMNMPVKFKLITN